ncbi:MAG: CPBP family intramembrane metalloprotease [Lachnospiraceae bacterium]|nr:CPBP family intramembrane metalloprotease [Lachnospiraceae bacterium]
MKNRLYLLLPIRSLMFVGVFMLLSLILGEKLENLFHWWSVIASIINVLVIGILLFLCKKQKITYGKLIQYEKGTCKWYVAFLIVVSMLMVGMGGMYLAGFICYGVFPYLAPMLIAPIPLILAIVNLFLLPITTTLAEDGLYLGLGVNYIKNKWIAIFVPAFFYAIQHSFIPMLLDGRYIMYRFLSFLPLTLWICYWYYKNRNPLPIMIGHGILNVATAVNILVTSAVPSVYEMMM